MISSFFFWGGILRAKWVNSKVKPEKLLNLSSFIQIYFCFLWNFSSVFFSNDFLQINHQGIKVLKLNWFVFSIKNDFEIWFLQGLCTNPWISFWLSTDLIIIKKLMINLYGQSILSWCRYHLKIKPYSTLKCKCQFRKRVLFIHFPRALLQISKKDRIHALPKGITVNVKKIHVNLKEG